MLLSEVRKTEEISHVTSTGQGVSTHQEAQRPLQPADRVPMRGYAVSSHNPQRQLFPQELEPAFGGAVKPLVIYSTICAPETTVRLRSMHA
jgi:hypothetical protein